MRLFTLLFFLALVARSNSSAGNAPRTDVGGSAEAAAAAEGRLVFIGNKSYVRWGVVGAIWGAGGCDRNRELCASCLR